MKNYDKPYLFEEELEVEDIIASSSGGVTQVLVFSDGGDEGNIGGLGWTPKGGN